MHRAETILEAVKTALTGLTTTAARVERDRVYPPESCPALSIEQGDELPADDGNLAFQDSALDVDVIAYVKSDSFNTQANQIRAEVYAAMMGNRTLGLVFVHDTRWLGDSRPEPSGDGETKTLRVSMRFRVFYRHSYTSKEA